MAFDDKMERKRYGDPKAGAEKGVARANMVIGMRVAAQAKLFAPVDYGQLRNSISASSLKESALLNDSSGEQGKALDTAGLKGDEVYVGANVEHAAPQEYGTYKTKAQPYLRPAKELIVDGGKLAEIVVKYGQIEMGKELKRER